MISSILESEGHKQTSNCGISATCFCVYERFDVGVREAVGVHGSEVSTAYDANDQAGLLGVVLERNHDASSFLQRFIFCLVDLHRVKKNRI